MQSGLPTVDANSDTQKSVHRFVLPCMFFICAERDWRDYINSLEQELNTLVRDRKRTDDHVSNCPRRS